MAAVEVTPPEVDLLVGDTFRLAAVARGSAGMAGEESLLPAPLGAVELSHEDEMRRLRLFKVESSDEGRGRGDAVLAHLSGLLAVPITREHER